MIARSVSQRHGLARAQALFKVVLLRSSKARWKLTRRLSPPKKLMKALESMFPEDMMRASFRPRELEGGGLLLV